MEDYCMVSKAKVVAEFTKFLREYEVDSGRVREISIRMGRIFGGYYGKELEEEEVLKSFDMLSKYYDTWAEKWRVFLVLFVEYIKPMDNGGMLQAILEFNIPLHERMGRLMGLLRGSGRVAVGWFELREDMARSKEIQAKYEGLEKDYGEGAGLDSIR